MEENNMNKRIAAILVLCMIMSGCSAADATPEQAQAVTAAANNYTAQEGDTVVTGEVTAIVGNEVTLALGELKQDERPQEGKKRRTDEQSDESGSSEKAESDSPAGGEPSAAGGEGMDGERRQRPDGENGERPDMAGGSSSGEKTSSGRSRGGPSRQRSSLEKSGEEAVYTIPVGMPIDGLSGRNTDYNGITVGTVLTLTLNSEGVVCAAKAE